MDNKTKWIISVILLIFFRIPTLSNSETYTVFIYLVIMLIVLYLVLTSYSSTCKHIKAEKLGSKLAGESGDSSQLLFSKIWTSSDIGYRDYFSRACFHSFLSEYIILLVLLIIVCLSFISSLNVETSFVLSSRIFTSIAGILAISIYHTSMIISILALTFTTFSFWWMNWRKGKIIVGDPRTFTLAAHGIDKLLIVQLPLVFYNTGAATQVVQNLRLTLEQNNNKSSTLTFNNTVSDLASNDGRQWGRQFPIEGRKTYSNIFVFQKTPGKFIPMPGKCKAILEWKSYDDMKWKQLHTFYLSINETFIKNMGTLTPYDNDPSA